MAFEKRILFPTYETKNNKIINDCEIYLTMKYERSPPKIKFEIPQTPNKPLEIIHIDVYTIGGKQILTIVDKFSKFGAADALISKNSLSIIKNLRHFQSLYGIPHTKNNIRSRH